jgi:hypothetical protein
MKVVSYERTQTHHKYVVSAKADHSVEILYRLRRSPLGNAQAEGGTIVGWSKTEEVQAFREASDWLSRFLHQQDGSPRAGDPIFQGLLPSAEPASEGGA